jgi:hypothetical protein
MADGWPAGFVPPPIEKWTNESTVFRDSLRDAAAVVGIEPILMPVLTLGEAEAKFAELATGGAAGVIVEDAPEGDRYPTAFSAVVAHVRIGLSDVEIITNVILPYLECFDRREQPARQTAIMSGLRWARREIGPDAATIAANIRNSDMFARWKVRWRHRT